MDYNDDFDFGEIPDDNGDALGEDMDACNDETFGTGIQPIGELEDYAAQTACLRLEDEWGKPSGSGAPDASQIPLPEFDFSALGTSPLNSFLGNDPLKLGSLWDTRPNTGGVFNLWGIPTEAKEASVSDLKAENAFVGGFDPSFWGEMSSSLKTIVRPQHSTVADQRVPCMSPAPTATSSTTNFAPPMPKAPTVEELESGLSSSVADTLSQYSSAVPPLPKGAVSASDLERSLLSGEPTQSHWPSTAVPQGRTVYTDQVSRLFEHPDLASTSLLPVDKASNASYTQHNDEQSIPSPTAESPTKTGPAPRYFSGPMGRENMTMANLSRLTHMQRGPPAPMPGGNSPTMPPFPINMGPFGGPGNFPLGMVPIWVMLLSGRMQRPPPDFPPVPPPPVVVHLTKQFNGDINSIMSALHMMRANASGQSGAPMPMMRPPSSRMQQPPPSANGRMSSMSNTSSLPPHLQEMARDGYHLVKPAGMPSGRTIKDLALDQFAGYMSYKERTWLVKIQLYQCAGPSGNPYEDDYYYTCWRAKRLAEGLKPKRVEEPTNEKDRELRELTANHEGKRRNRERENGTEGSEVERPHKFADSLGMPSKSTTSNPRHLIAVQHSDTASVDEDTSKKVASSKKLRSLLLRLEGALLLLVQCHEMLLTCQKEPYKEKSVELQKEISERTGIVLRELFLDDLSKVLQVSKGRDVVVRMLRVAEPKHKAQTVLRLANVAETVSVKHQKELSRQLVPAVYLGLANLDRQQLILLAGSFDHTMVQKLIAAKNVLFRDVILTILWLCTNKSASSPKGLFVWLRSADHVEWTSSWSSPMSAWSENVPGMGLKEKMIMADWLMLQVENEFSVSVARSIAIVLREVN